jgi:glycosyltransferase involved in cell wall biosynthesis
MERYKVALVCDWYLPRVGGIENQLRDLARALNARGHEAHIICSTPSSGTSEADGVKVHRLDVPLLPSYQSVMSTRAVGLMQELLLRERFDIVHCHSAFSPLALVGMFVAKRLGIPSVYTEHSVLRGTGVTVFRALNYVLPWVTWPTVHSAVSNFVADDIRTLAGRQDVLVLHNGVDPSEWQKERAHAEPVVRDRPLRLTSVMRFTKRKRPLDIVRAIPRVLAQLPPHIEPCFTLVGDGPERGRVEREAQRLQVTPYLELTGMRTGAEVRDILARSDIFILPSIKEAHNRAVLEALSAGLPVVARTPNGVSDSVEPGREGLLARTLDDFADCIARLILDEPLRKRMAENACKRLDRFSWDHVVSKHVDAYRLASRRCGKLPHVDVVPTSSSAEAKEPIILAS